MSRISPGDVFQRDSKFYVVVAVKGTQMWYLFESNVYYNTGEVIDYTDVSSWESLGHTKL